MRRNVQPIQAVVGLTIIAITVMAIAVIMLLWDLRSREIEHSRIETISLTEMLLDQTEQVISNADLVLRSIQEKLQSNYAKQFSLSSAPVHLLLGARVAGMQQVRSLFIVSNNGYVINSSRELPGSDVPALDRDYYQAFAKYDHDGLFIGKPVIGRADGEWTIHLARRLNDAQDNFIGIIVISLSMNYFEKAYDFAKLDIVRPIAMYMDDGTLVASSPRRNEAIGSVAPELANTTLPNSGSEIRLHTRYGDNQRKERFSLVKAENMPFLISVTDDEHNALASWRETAKPIAIGSALIGVFIIIVAVRLIIELQREALLSRALREADERHVQTIEAANQQLRDLSSALQEVREEERTFLSRELHDELGQQLTGLKLDLTWLATRIREGRTVEPERMVEMRQLLDNLIASVRRISGDLRPPVLDDLGFCEAVRWLKQETEKRSDLVIDAELPAGPLITDKDLATALFRIVQEALTNILRHADATRASIKLLADNGKLDLTIQDNGKGTDQEAPAAGIGLISMRERVTALGGEFSFTSETPGHGVSLKAIIPFPQPDIGKTNT